MRSFRNSARFSLTIPRGRRKSVGFELLMNHDESEDSLLLQDDSLKPQFDTFEEESGLDIVLEPIQEDKSSASTSEARVPRNDQLHKESQELIGANARDCDNIQSPKHSRISSKSVEKVLKKSGPVSPTRPTGRFAKLWKGFTNAAKMLPSKVTGLVGTVLAATGLISSEAAIKCIRKRRFVKRFKKLQAHVKQLEERVVKLESAPRILSGESSGMVRATPVSSSGVAGLPPPPPSAMKSNLPPPPPSAMKSAVPPMPPSVGANRTLSAAGSSQNSASMTLFASEPPSMSSIAAAAAAIAARRLSAMGSNAAPSYIPPVGNEVVTPLRPVGAMPPPPPPSANNATATRGTLSDLPPTTPRSMGSIVTVDILRSVKLRSATAPRTTSVETPTSTCNADSALQTPSKNGFRPTLQDILSVKLRPGTPHCVSGSSTQPDQIQSSMSPNSTLLSPVTILRNRMGVCPSTRMKIDQRARLASVADIAEEEENPSPIGSKRKTPLSKAFLDAAENIEKTPNQRVCRTPLRPMENLVSPNNKNPPSATQPLKALKTTPSSAKQLFKGSPLFVRGSSATATPIRKSPLKRIDVPSDLQNAKNLLLSEMNAVAGVTFD